MTEYTGQRYTLAIGDCLALLKELPDACVDSIVTDPPYGLSEHKPEEVIACLTAWIAGKPYEIRKGKKGFMGKSWDAWVPGPEVWRECLRVLKPGGHMLVFAGTRSMDLMCMAVRLAGFEMRDSINFAHSGDPEGEGDPTQAPLLGWAFGSGFPKSLNVQQAINKAAAGFPQGGADPTSPNSGKFLGGCSEKNETGRGFGAGPGNYMAEQATARGGDEGPHKGWGTALKPSVEPIILARKPLTGTVAQNVLQYGTGALNIDGCRVGVEENGRPHRVVAPMRDDVEYAGNSLEGRVDGSLQSLKAVGSKGHEVVDALMASNPDATYDQIAMAMAEDIRRTGRWPANLLHDGSPEVLAVFPQQKSGTPGVRRKIAESTSMVGVLGLNNRTEVGIGDSGSAARFFYNTSDGNPPSNGRDGEASAQRRYTDEGSTNFAATPGARRPAVDNQSRLFYCAKASKSDRNEGLDDFEPKRESDRVTDDGPGGDNPRNRTNKKRANHHTTVKPTRLMRYLCKLVTPPDGLILDPFAGSGSTGKGAIPEGFRFVGMELSPEYGEIANARLAHAEKQYLAGETAEQADPPDEPEDDTNQEQEQSLEDLFG